ncbi:sialic acid-binding Ig-like lectin 13 [Pleurodeles waltl]|uniref:sialic acid-binding Ig-like lectin 13 n=1 Tax=Pleurodeles waltl TaxID=8319 RepID=UPI003709B4F5
MELGTVLVLSLLWKGALCPSEDYTLTVTSPVRAQKGLCVLIPCTFTYEDTTESPGRAHGYWFIKGDPRDKAVATNDVNKQIYGFARGHFRLAGDVRSRDCSLSINDIRSWDKKTYFFRYEHSEASKFKWNYVGFPLRVTVLDLQDKPTIDLPPALTEGANVSVNCTAPGRCSGTPPSISWTMGWNSAYSTMNRTVNHSDDTQSHISEITFQVSREHNRKQLDCTAYFSTVGASATSSATLNVEYPPMTPTISVSITDREGIMRTTNATSVEVLEGSNCSLHCTADSEPLSNLTWMMGGLILNESAFVSNNLQLIRLNISPKDDGIYHCAAAYKTGREQSSVTVTIQYAPRIAAINSSSCQSSENAIMCICVVEAYPLPTIEWKINENILPESFQNGSMQQAFSLHSNLKNSTLIMNISDSPTLSITCIFSNKHGTGAEILKSPESFSTSSSQGASTGAIIGIAVAITLLFMLLVGMSLCITRKIRKKGNSGSGTLNEASHGTTVDSTYQELQRRQSDTYGELKIDRK